MRATPVVHSSRSLLFAVCAALSACSPTEPRDFLDARISLEEEAVTSGASSFAHVEVTNRGSEAIEIEVETCPPRILVYDRRGNQVGQPSVACLLILSAPVVLEPGDTHAHVQGWLAQDERGAPLPAGTYRVQVWVAHRGVGLPVLTNRAEVSVLAATE
jgi:hypothetical protein